MIVVVMFSTKASVNEATVYTLHTRSCSVVAGVHFLPVTLHIYARGYTHVDRLGCNANDFGYRHWCFLSKIATFFVE